MHQNRPLSADPAAVRCIVILPGRDVCALMIFSTEIAILLYRETDMKSVNVSAVHFCLYQHYYGILSTKSTKTATLFNCNVFLTIRADFVKST
jgi:hypothetical protein